MIAPEFEAAAEAGRPFAVEFQGIRNYSSSNEDNLQVGLLRSVSFDQDKPNGRCRIEFDDPSEGPIVRVEFSYASAVPILM